MATNTIPSFAQSFQDFLDYAAHATRRLTYGQHNYVEGVVNVIHQDRCDVTLGTPSTHTNCVMTSMETQLTDGWYLKTQQSDEEEEIKWFFLSRSGEVTVIWEGWSHYATLITPSMLLTALYLLSEKEMADIAAELRQIVRK